MAIATAALVLTAIAGLGQAFQQKQTGKAQSQALKAQAKEEEVAARDRELQRKTRLNKVLAAQIAGQGASGVTGEGSQQAIALNSIREASLGDLAGEANASGIQQRLKNQSKTARKLGNLSAATTLLSTGANIGITGSQLEVF